MAKEKTVKKGAGSTSKGKTSTVIAKGDTYDTGKNTAKAASENHGHESHDPGRDAFFEETSEIVACEDTCSTGSLVSTIIIAKSTVEMAVSSKVNYNRKTRAGGVAPIFEHVCETGVDHHVKDVK